MFPPGGVARSAKGAPMSGLRRPRRTLFLLSLAATPGASPSSWAQSPPVAAPVPSNAQVVRQKETLVKSLLGDSPVAARINASQNVEARRFFATAQDHYNQAVLHLQNGDTAKAEQLLNDAMWNIGRARQLVPDPVSRAVEDRVRYARLLEGIESLRASYARHLERGKDRLQGAGPRELERIDAMVEEAKTRMNAEKVGDAVNALEQAQRALLVGINRLLGSATLEYAEKFDDPAEEFAYELERNRSAADLVPVAVAELKPSEDAKRLIKRYVDQSSGMREQAQREAGGKDYNAALKSIRTATSYLQRALLAAGLLIPREATGEGSE